MSPHLEVLNLDPERVYGPISASLRLGNTASFKEMLQLWRAAGDTMSNLTEPKFEPQTSCSRDELVTAQLTGRLMWICQN